MRKSISDTILSTTQDLQACGLVDKITMRNIENLCLPEIKEYNPEEIVKLRNTYSLSQPAFARVINVKPTTVKQWEKGNNKPDGAARKLLSLIENKGLEAVI